MYTYNAKVERVVDGDTVDALVDLGLTPGRKFVSDYMVWTHGNPEPETLMRKRKRFSC